MDHPAWEQQAPPATHPGDAPPSDPWAPREPATNPLAVWSWVVALPCAALGVVFGVLGLARARRRGGVGATHALVGLTASAFVLLACAAALPAAAVVGLVASSGSGGGWDGTSETTLSADEQDFLDGLYDDTYYAYDDSTLLDMGHGFCADLDAGRTPADADAALVARWAEDDLGLDTAYDVEATATTSLCPAHADEFSAWDPTATDPGLTT